MSASDSPAQFDSTARSGNFFIRYRGRVTGPFDWNRIQTLKKRGQLTPNHELSSDRTNWRMARTVRSLFPEGSRSSEGSTKKRSSAEKTVKTEVAAAADATASASTPGVGDWYWSVDGQQNGPFNEFALQQLVEEGTVPAEALVWSPPLDGWKPLSEVPAFSAIAAAEFSGLTPAVLSQTPRNDGQAVRRDLSSNSAGFEQVQTGRLWNSLLNSARHSCPASTLENISQQLMFWGDCAFAVGTMIIPGILLFAATRTDSARLIFYAMGAFCGLAILKYISGSMNQAIHKLVVASPSRLASPAFLNSFALLSLGIGIGTAAALTMLAFQQDVPNWWLLGPALQNLLSFLFLSHVALQPGWLNVEIRQDTTAGEEGIGIIAFQLKALLRLTPVYFGTGSVAATLGLLTGCMIYLSDAQDSVPYLLTLLQSAGMLLVMGVLPLFTYVVAVLLFIPLDLIRSVIWIPGKIEELKSDPESTSH